MERRDQGPAEPEREQSWGWLESPVRRRIALGALALLTCLLYAPALTGRFVLDDVTYFVENDLLPPLKPWNIWTIVSRPSNYWNVLLPVRDFAYVVQHTLFGSRTLGYHAVSLLLYVATGAVAYRFLCRMYRDLGRVTAPHGAALAAVAIFLVHPAHVEIAAYVSSQKDLLLGVFSLLAIERAYAAFREDALFDWRKLTPIILLYYAALLSKLTAVATGLFIPLLWLIVEPWSLRKHGKAFALWSVVNTLPLAWLLWSQRMLATYWSTEAALLVLPLPVRLMRAVRLAGAHTRILVWPHPLSFGYPFDSAGVLDGWFFLGAAALLACALAVWRRQRLLCVAAALFIVYLFPSLRVINVPANTMVYDRYLHIPLLGWAIAVERAFAALRKTGRLPAPVPAAMFCMYAAILMMLTAAYAPTFRSNVAVTRHTYTQYPAWPSSAFNYVDSLVEAGDLGAARALLRDEPTLRSPNWVPGYFEGLIRLAEGRPADAAPLLIESTFQSMQAGYYPFAAVPAARALLALERETQARMMLQPAFRTRIPNPLERYRALQLEAELDRREAQRPLRLQRAFGGT